LHLSTTENISHISHFSSGPLQNTDAEEEGVREKREERERTEDCLDREIRAARVIAGVGVGLRGGEGHLNGRNC